MAIRKPLPVEDVLLCELHRELMRRHDYEGAEEVVDLLAAVAAVEELTAAVERGDGQATAFHAGLVLRNLETGRHPEIPAAE